jgi:hypothetical protein
MGEKGHTSPAQRTAAHQNGRSELCDCTLQLTQCQQLLNTNWQGLPFVLFD